MVHFGGHRVFEPFINRTAFYDSKYREAQYSDPTVVNLKSCVGPSPRIAWTELVQLQLQQLKQIKSSDTLQLMGLTCVTVAVAVAVVGDEEYLHIPF